MSASTAFAEVADTLDGFAEADPGYNAQLAVYVHGELVLDRSVGSEITADSLLPIYSSSKGVTGIAVALLVDRGLLDLDERVSTYWPEFAVNGKTAVTVRQLLSHQAGLIGVDGGYTVAELLAHTPLAERLAAQRPFWQPGTAVGYHALTIGTLADELVRRIDGRPVAQLLREDITGPRAIDVYLATPESEDHRVARALMPSTEEITRFFATPTPDPEPVDGVVATTMPIDGMDLVQCVNDPAFRRAGVPAVGGLASARGLAKLYACVERPIAGERLLTDATLGQVSQQQVLGGDFGDGKGLAFGVLFQKPVSPRWPFGTFRAYGHDGAGGSLAFSDPTHGVAFAYTVQGMPLPAGMDARAIDLSRRVRQLCV